MQEPRENMFGQPTNWAEEGLKKKMNEARLALQQERPGEKITDDDVRTYMFLNDKEGLREFEEFQRADEVVRTRYAANNPQDQSQGLNQTGEREFSERDANSTRAANDAFKQAFNENRVGTVDSTQQAEATVATEPKQENKGLAGGIVNSIRDFFNR